MDIITDRIISITTKDGTYHSEDGGQILFYELHGVPYYRVSWTTYNGKVRDRWVPERHVLEVVSERE